MPLEPSSGRLEAEALAKAPAERYDRVVRLAQAIFGAPIAALNLVGTESQYTVASVGYPTGSIPVEESVCRVTVGQDEILEVRDLREDPRFASIPAVAGPPRVRFYAGVPVHGQSGQAIGTLCIFDLVPRELGRTQREMLGDLGAVLERELAVQEEMALAGQVQRLMLPSEPPDLPGIEVAGRVQPAREAGGDFYDWLVIDDRYGDRQLQVVLGDVMGKGLPASLIASEVRAVLRGHSRYYDIGGAVRSTSQTTRHDLEANGRFSTLWAGRVDPASGRLSYVDAGHGLAIIAGPRGPRRLIQEYLPLGTFIEDTWMQASDTLAEDELLVIVSDGVFDVLGDDYDVALTKLPAILDPGLSCAEIVDIVVDYAVSHDATDDVTAVVARRTGEDRS
ncbi:MAG: SpoIIE family protein phosphatase [Promicromonosporaceae bacterium]|nr:SpoIIE family protein phosphatase [Promicromonosporaceae bacterium]